MLTYWLLWLMGGVVYYGYYCEFGMMKGLYMAVNIGYSIGWNHPTMPKDITSILFSIGFELLGSSAIAYSLQIFAETILIDDREWYVKALRREKYEAQSKSKSWFLKICSCLHLESDTMIPFAMCLLWLSGGAFTAYFYIDHWSSYESFYFAFALLSTGGQQPIPSDSPNHYFLIVGLYAAVGTPLMAYSLGCLASLFIKGPNIKVLEVITSKITSEDLATMQKYGLENSDGAMDRAEYLILCMLRLGVVDPELVSAIVNRYNELDESGDGLLSYKELLEHNGNERDGERGSIHQKRVRSTVNVRKQSDIHDSDREVERRKAEKHKDEGKSISQKVRSSDETTNVGAGESRRKDQNNSVLSATIHRNTSEESDEGRFADFHMEEKREVKEVLSSVRRPNRHTTIDSTNPETEASAVSSRGSIPRDSEVLRAKGQILSARVLQLKRDREREKEKSILISSGIIPSLTTPVKPIPLSSSLERFMDNNHIQNDREPYNSSLSFSTPLNSSHYSQSQRTLPLHLSISTPSQRLTQTRPQQSNSLDHSHSSPSWNRRSLYPSTNPA